MTKGIPSRVHSFLDVGFALFAFAAPRLFHFHREKPAAPLSLATGLGVLAYSACTDYKLGFVKAIPYKTHAAIDFALGLGSAAVPLMAPRHFSKRSKAVFLGMGLVSIVVGTLSMIAAVQEGD